MIQTWIEPLLGFVLSALGVAVALAYARRTGLVDVPNDRSSHSIPTPRGGGIAIVAAVIAIFAVDSAQLADGTQIVFAVLAVSIAGLSFIGWLDDTGRLSVGIRLSVHIACGGAVALLVNAIAPVHGSMNIVWLAWWIVWSAASINIVNFMDGIDGIVAAQGVIYGIFLFAILPDGSPGSRLGLVLAAACCGFLVWNWAPAKMFMGDAGSGPLGILFVVGGALALKHTRVALIFLPLYPLFLDALITIVRRYRNGEALTQAHRQHLYQRIANSAVGHAPVSLAYALAAAVGALSAILVKDATAPLLTAAVVMYLILVGLVWTIADARWKSVEPR